MKDTLATLIVAQAGREWLSYRFYHQCSLWCNLQGWSGAEHYFRLQALEEEGHGNRWLDYLVDVHDRLVPLPDYPPARPVPTTLLAVFESSLALELEGTDWINGISVACDAEEDQLTRQFVDWFLREQELSLREFRTQVRRLQRAGSDVAALLRIDHELGKRT